MNTEAPDDKLTYDDDEFRTPGSSFELEPEMKQERVGFAEHILRGSVGSIGGAADTILSSLGFTDEDSDFLPEVMETLISDEQRTYYENNRETLQAVGEVATLLNPRGPIVLGVKLVQSGGRAEKILNATPYARRLRPLIISSGRTVAEKSDRIIAGAQISKAGVVNNSLFSMEDTRKLLQSGKWQQAADTTKEAVAAEAAIVATLSDSELLFGDDGYSMGDLGIALGANAVFAGLGVRALDKAVKTGITAKVSDEALKVRTAEGGVTGEWAAANLHENLKQPETSLAVFGLNASSAQVKVDELVLAAEKGEKVDSGLISQARKTVVVFQKQAANAAKSLAGKQATEAGTQRVVELASAAPGALLHAKYVAPIDISAQQAVLAKQLVDEQPVGLSPEGELMLPDVHKQVMFPDDRMVVADAHFPLPGLEAPKLAKQVVNRSVEYPAISDLRGVDLRANHGALGEIHVSVDGNGKLTGPLKAVGNTEFDMQGNMHKASKLFIENMEKLDVAGDALKPAFVLSKIKHFAQIDALQGSDLWARIPVKDQEALLIKGIKQKYTVYNKLTSKAGRNMFDRPVDADIVDDLAAQIVNIPTSDVGYFSAMQELFVSQKLLGKRTLNEVLGDNSLKPLLGQLSGLAKKPVGVDALTGTAFAREAGAGFVPTLAVHAEAPLHSAAPIKEINAASRASKARGLQFLTQDELYGKDLMGFIKNKENGPLIKQALNVGGLVEGTKRFKGVFASQDYATAGIGQLEAAHLIHTRWDGMAKAKTNKLLASVMSRTEEIRKPKNKGAEAQAMLAVSSLQKGWHVVPQQGAAQGKFQRTWLLDPNSSQNKRIFETLPEALKIELRGKFEAGLLDMPVSAVLKEGRYEPATITDELAAGLLDEFNDQYQRVLGTMNLARKKQGRNQIGAKPYYVPPQNYATGYVGMVVRADGEIVEGFRTNTRAEYDSAAAAVSARSPGSVVMTYDEVAATRDVADVAWGGAIDFTNIHAQTGGAKGKSGTFAAVGSNALTDMVSSLVNTHASLRRQTMEMAFAPQFAHAKRLEAVSGYAPKKGVDADKLKDSSIARAWKNAMLGLHPKQTELQKGITSVADKGIQYGAALFGAGGGALGNRLGRVERQLSDGSIATREQAKQFKELEESMGGYNPFKTLDEYARNTLQVKMPPTLASVSSTMNKVAYHAFLGMGDVGIALLNYSSLLATLPATLRVSRPTRTELAGGEAGMKLWKDRTALWGTPTGVNHADGFPEVMPHTGRMAQTMMEGLFDKDTARALKQIGDEGHLHAVVVEQLNDFTAPASGWLTSILTKGADKAAFFARKSEEHTKVLTASAAYTMGRKSYGLSHEQAITHAVHQIHKTVGNYAPHMRPQVFQGATGLAPGLFTTWVMNFLQRVYGDIEGLRHNAAFFQMGLHSFLLGAETLPGWDLLSDKMFATYNGQESLNVRMNNSFGVDAADFMLYGSLSSASKLFTDGGVSIHSRGSVGLPAIYAESGDMTQLPQVSLMKDWATGLKESVESVATNGGFNSQEIAEIWGLYAGVGHIKASIDHGLGYDINRSRELLVEEFDSATPIIARYLELKPLNEVREQEALWQIKSGRAAKAGILRNVSQALRAAARGGTLDAELIERLSHKALRAGVSPKLLKSYLTRQVKYGVESKTQRELHKGLNGNSDQDSMSHLFDVMSHDGI